MVIGDDDVEASRHRKRDLGSGARSAVDRHDHGDAACDGDIDRRGREPVPLLEPARDVGLHLDAEPPQRDDEDRQPVEPVRVEVAEDHHAFTALARDGQSGDHAVRVRKQVWVVESRDRFGEPGGEIASTEDAASGQKARHALGESMLACRSQEVGVDGMSFRERPAKPRLEHRVRMPRVGHLRLNRASPTVRRSGRGSSGARRS